MRTLGIFLAAASLALCLGQDKPAAAPQAAPEAAPPPEVDKALRERVSLFFQDMVDGKYRQAEQYVAEDTKDTYYNMQKPTYLGFEIAKVTYSDDFTKAHVVAQCQREVVNPAMGRVVMKVPQITDWKIENGLWCWHVDANQPVRTPFGMMQHHTGARAGGRPQAPQIADLAKAVSVDTRQVRLGANAVSGQVVVTNSMPGDVSLALDAPATPGLEVKLDRTQLAGRQAATISFHYTPQPVAPKPVVVTVSVQPTGMTIPIQVTFEPAAQARQ
jgi:phage-related baseplate assembly protein